MRQGAKVLSVGYFTILQVLFLSLLYAPPLIGFLGLIAFAEIGEFFMTAYLWEFIGVGFLIYLFAFVSPFAGLLWVMVIKLFMGGDIYSNNVTPGVYPKWSRMHLRTWCIGRLEATVLSPLEVMFRSAPLKAYVLRRLGATVGDNLQCAHNVEFSGPLDLLSTEDDVAIQTGAYIHMSRWVGQELHIGPVHLESGCKIGMRAAVADHVTVGPRHLDHSVYSHPQRRRFGGDVGGSPGAIQWPFYGTEAYGEKYASTRTRSGSWRLSTS